MEHIRGRLLGALQGAIGAFDRTIGWHRAGIALSIVIVVVAATILYRILQGVEFGKVTAALCQTDAGDIAFAALCVAGAYLTLTCYDLFALRTIRRPDVPYRIAALASFTSFSIGHNLGGAVVTAGAIRYRIYSAWNLSLIDVAKICFVTGLTFWLGNAFVLGIALALEPAAASAVDHLPASANRAIAFILLAAIGCYVAWVWRRPRRIGMNNWQVTLPGGPITLVQIAIGVFDLTFCALAMYVLLPDQPAVGLIAVIVIFIFATLLGFASYAPSGLGIFDAAMIVALQQFPKEEMLASLLLFRLIYYIIPFVLALIAIGIREVTLNLASHRANAPARRTEPDPSR